MRACKIVHFQVCPDGIYVLDEAGSIWKNTDIKDARGWKSVPVPTQIQHDIEDAAIKDRSRVYDISHKE
jgi:hypothetical protein